MTCDADVLPSKFPVVPTPIENILETGINNREMDGDDETQVLKEEMLSVRVMNGENSVFIALKGEVDVSTAPELLEIIHTAFERNPMSIVLDVAELVYIDSVGLGVLVTAHKRAQAARTAFFLSSPTPRVLRLLEMTGLKDVLSGRQFDLVP